MNMVILANESVNGIGQNPLLVFNFAKYFASLMTLRNFSTDERIMLSNITHLFKHFL